MNCKHFYAKLIICLLLLTSCSKSEDLSVDLQINNFVWKGLNAYYLWQSDVPDLQDRRFGNQSQLNSYLSGFSSPESLFESLLNRPEDRFSVIVDDYIALENSFQGINLSNGMEFGLVRYKDGSSNIYGYVRYVIPNSDADNMGIIRGMLFNKVNGIQLTDTNFFNFLFRGPSIYTIGLADYNDGNPIFNNITYTLTKSEIEENPIKIAKIFTENNTKIGYLMYNQFARNYDLELNSVFGNFKSENIDELIVDLRYNPGGFTSSASHLASMITGQFTGELFSKESWNNKVMNSIPSDNFENRFLDKIRIFDQNRNIIKEEGINSLGLNRVYFIVSGSTASASELLINSLSPYIDVRIIGLKTEGKVRGSVTLYDSDNYLRNGKNFNLNHTYAMQPLVLEIVNKNGDNFPNGMIPAINLQGIQISENFGNLGVLGDRNELLLNRTIFYILTGQKKIEAQKELTIKEFYSSKLATPTSNNMYSDFLKK